MDLKYLVFTQIGFVLLSLIFVGLFIWEIFNGIGQSAWDEQKKKSVKTRILIGLALWLVAVSIMSITGFLGDFSTLPPRMMIVLVIPLAISLVMTFSGKAKEILSRIPPHRLIRLQVFRLFVEVLLWMLFVDNLFPVQMTFEGRNFDIIAGITGPLVAFLFRNNRRLMIAWNFVGLALLFNILTIAILSMPLPFRIFFNDPANIIVAEFPIVFLPAFLVPLAYTIHFFSLRQLTIKN